MLLDTELDFQEHLKSLPKMVNKTIGLLRKRHDTLPRLLFGYNLQVIYKTPSLLWGCHIRLGIQRFISPKIRIYPIQLKKLYNKLGLETLEKRRWYRKECCFYKVYKSHSPKYFLTLFPLP